MNGLQRVSELCKQSVLNTIHSNTNIHTQKTVTHEIIPVVSTKHVCTLVYKIQN